MPARTSSDAISTISSAGDWRPPRPSALLDIRRATTTQPRSAKGLSLKAGRFYTEIFRVKDLFDREER